VTATVSLVSREGYLPMARHQAAAADDPDQLIAAVAGGEHGASTACSGGLAFDAGRTYAALALALTRGVAVVQPGAGSATR
jgi:hypothetical protein